MGRKDATRVWDSAAARGQRDFGLRPVPPQFPAMPTPPPSAAESARQRAAQLDAKIVEQRTTIADLRAAVADLTTDNARLRRAGVRSEVDDWMAKSIANLACSQVDASSEALCGDPGVVAFHQARAAAMGERIRSCKDGWDIHRQNQPDLVPLLAWLADERGRWEFHATPPADPASDEVGQRANDGWAHEAIAHRDGLSALHTRLTRLHEVEQTRTQ